MKREHVDYLPSMPPLSQRFYFQYCQCPLGSFQKQIQQNLPFITQLYIKLKQNVPKGQRKLCSQIQNSVLHCKDRLALLGLYLCPLTTTGNHPVPLNKHASVDAILQTSILQCRSKDLCDSLWRANTKGRNKTQITIEKPGRLSYSAAEYTL